MNEETKTWAPAFQDDRAASPPPSPRPAVGSGTFARVQDMRNAAVNSSLRSNSTLTRPGLPASKKDYSKRGSFWRAAQRRLPIKKPMRRRGKKDDGRRCGVQWSIRAKQIMWWVLSQCILIAMVATALVLLEMSLLKVYTQASKDQIGLVDMTYQLKMNQMGLGFYGNSLNGYLIDFLRLDAVAQADTSTELHDQMLNVLESELRSRQIEFSLLVNATGHIVATGNRERQAAFSETSVGDSFNPNGLMHRILAKKDHVGYQVKSSVILPRAQVVAERPPVWRERPQAFLPSGDYHWTDRPENDCLVRFTLTSIHADPKDASSFLGVVVSGDVLNGKIPVAYNVVDALEQQAGFVGVYVRDAAHNRFVKSSLYFRSFRGVVAGGHDFVLDSADADPAPQSILREAMSRGRGSPATDHNSNFVLAATPVPPGTIQESQTDEAVRVDEDIPEAVIVRGFDLAVHTTFAEVRDLTLITVGVVLFIELVTLLLSLRYLITPLEAMAYALRRGVRLQETDFDKLHVGRLSAFALLLSALPALGCIIFVVFANIAAINAAMLESAEGQVGAGTIAFQLKVDQMSFGFFGDANQEAIHSALLNRTDASSVNAATAILHAEIEKRRIEFATLVDMEGIVVASPNADRVGEIFDPAGIVSATTTSQERQKWTAPLSFADLLKESPPQWQERLHASTPASGLHPFDTEESTIVRYTTTLVDADADGRFDGVLVSGDIVSGKTAMVEAVLDVNDVGYEAVYLKDGGRWILCASTERYDLSRKVRVDVPFPYEDVLNEVLEEGHAESRFGTINGKDYVFAATALENSVAITDKGEELELDRDAVVVIVHGNPTTNGDSIKKEQTIVIIVILVLQFITSVVGVWIAFDPLRKMLIVLERYGFARKATSWIGCFGVLEGTSASLRTSDPSDPGDAPPAPGAPADAPRSPGSPSPRAPSETLTRLINRFTESVSPTGDSERCDGRADLADPEAAFEEIHLSNPIVGHVAPSDNPSLVSLSRSSSATKDLVDERQDA